MDAPILRLDRYISSQPHILSLGPRVSLEITRGRVQQRIRPVNRPVFLIGAAPDCDLVLGDPSFPEAYAYLFVQESRISIRRLGTGPELAVSGDTVETAELADGDRLAFGPFEVCLHIESPCPKSGVAEPGDDCRSIAACFPAAGGLVQEFPFTD